MRPGVVIHSANLFGFLIILSSVQSEKIIARFEGIALRTLAKDPSSARIYVGGQNYLYELESNLTIVAKRTTGPRNDSSNCPPDPNKSCAEPRRPKNSTNLLLVIDGENRAVIACYTLFYGFCEKYSVNGLGLVQSFFVQVVTNSELGAVGMITDGFGGNKLLYVGSAPSVVGHHSEVGAKQIPMLATRNLNTLQIAFSDISAASFKDYHSEYRKAGYIIFKEIFEHGSYIYYLTVQKERSGRDSSGGSNYKSYLVRTCKYDKKYQSYIQIPLKCDVWPESFNIAQTVYKAKPGKKLAEQNGLSEDQEALFISFSKSFPQSSEIVLDSALCVYSFDAILRTFAQSLAGCFKGNGYLGPEFLKKTREDCLRRQINVGESYCGEHDVNHPINGQTDAMPQWSGKIGKMIVNSLLVKTTGDATIALMGTSNGELLKMVVEEPSPGVYHTMPLATGEAVRHDMEFDSKKDNIYVMTSAQVMKVQLADCDIYDDCDSCLTAGDPHCGWCFTYNKCTTERKCPSSAQYENYEPWLSYKSVCPAITSVQPNPIGYDAIQQIELEVKVSELPNMEQGKLFCELHAHIFRKTAPATWQAGGNTVDITCQPFQNLQSLPNHESNLVAQLSVKLEKITWASSSLVVYDCSARGDSCHSCTSTDFPCTWCVSDHRCISSNQNCSDANKIHSVNPSGPVPLPQNGQVGSEFCPRVQLVDNNNLTTHSGVNKVFTVQALNLKSGMTKSLQCKFSLQGREWKVGADFLKDVVKCQLVALEYRQDMPFENAKFELVWGTRGYPLDNPDDVKVKVYKCSLMEDHCGKCLVLDPVYGCGWCPAGPRTSGQQAGCSLSNDCKTTWMNYTEDCPNVQIEGVQPTSGPVRGGTNITVTGKNMGKVKADLVNVNVAAGKCTIIEYEPSTRFVCTTGPAKNTSSGPVYVDVKGKYTGTSDLQYTYVDPVIRDFFPEKGPKAGGTNVTLTGLNFDGGNEVSVSIEGEPCTVHGRNSTALWFTTARHDHPMKANIKLKVDNSQDIIAPKKFFYGENPIIRKIRPDRAIISGGNILDVEGVDLNVVQNPKFFVQDGSRTKMTDCMPTTVAAFMHCPAPDVSSWKLDISEPIMMNYGFVMDGVTELLNISQEAGFQPLTYYPNPMVLPFRSVKRYVKGEPLTIKGQNLLELRVFKDINISVGGAACTKEEVISDVRIICNPPTPDMGQKLNKDGNAEVMFTLGNFKTSLGYLRYKGGPGLALGAVIGIVAGVLVLIVLAVILFVVCRRRKNKKKEMPAPSFIYKPKSRPNQYEGAEGGGELGEGVPLRSDTDGTASAEQPDGKQDEETYLSSVLSRIENVVLRKKVQEVLISRKRVEVREELGKGHFGVVFLANLLDGDLDNPREVAVKTLQGTDLDQKQIESFLREGVIMKRFRHLHIMSLLGVCIGPNQEPMVILPYMANGDLRTYVKDKKKNFTARQLLHLAQQVAEGMAYLASLNFVHRDLAARNCMIDDTSTVKVADFGLTREIYEREYYSLKDRKAKLPIKWMALESLEDYVFTMKSDIWSFGILMWELMTRGVTPYPDVDAFDLRTYLASSRRLRKPKYCPDNVYKIMLDCWDEIPERRPNFAELVNRLEMLLNPPKKRTSSKEEQEPIYQNLNKVEPSDYLNPVTPDAED